MANTRSAEKQNRQAQKHRARNSRIISTLRTQVRKVREAMEKGEAAQGTPQPEHDRAAHGEPSPPHGP